MHDPASPQASDAEGQERRRHPRYFIISGPKATLAQRRELYTQWTGLAHRHGFDPVVTLTHEKAVWGADQHLLQLSRDGEIDGSSVLLSDLPTLYPERDAPEVMHDIEFCRSHQGNCPYIIVVTLASSDLAPELRDLTSRKGNHDAVIITYREGENPNTLIDQWLRWRVSWLRDRGRQRTVE